MKTQGEMGVDWSKRDRNVCVRERRVMNCACSVFVIRVDVRITA